MAFALSGTTITQTGTDTSLAGIGPIAGVDEITSGSGATQFTIYNLGNNILKIDGTLTLDPRKEQLICSVDDAIEVRSGGTFNLGVQETADGYTSDTPLTGLIGTKPSNPWHDWGILIVSSGGTLNWNGTAIYSAGSIAAQSGSTVNVKNGMLYSNDDAIDTSVAPGRGFITWLKTANLTIDGLTMIKGELVINGAAKDGTISHITRKHAKIAVFSHALNDITYQDNSIGDHGNVIDYCIQTEGVAQGIVNSNIINEKTGTDIIVLGGENGVDKRNKGRLAVSKKIRFRTTDHDDHPVSGVRFFILDKDNGHRKNLNGYDDTADKTYTEVSDGTGYTPELNIITGIINVEGGTSGSDPKNKNRGTSNTSPYDWDLRGQTNTPGDDKFAYNGWSYHHLHVAGSLILKGNCTLEVDQKLFHDDLITEQTQGTVDAYAELDSIYKLYDFAKSHLTKLQHMQHQSSDSHDILLTRDGKKITTNNRGLTIDRNAAQVFDFDHNTDNITIKAAEFTGDIDCGTGTLRLLNGATVDGTVLDSNGDSTLIFSVPSQYTLEGIYSTQNDADHDTNKSASIPADKRWQYKSSDYGGKIIFIRLTRQGGESTVPYSVSASPGVYNAHIFVTSIDLAQESIEDKIQTVLANQDIMIANQNTKPTLSQIENADITRTNSKIDAAKAKADSIAVTVTAQLDKKLSDLHDFDYRVDPVDVNWINGTTITSLSMLKNTASEIAAGTEKGLRELPQAEKDKYKAGSVAVDLTATNQKIDGVKTQTDKIPGLAEKSDIAAVSTKADELETQIDGIETKIDGIKNEITQLITDTEILRKIKLNDYDMDQISETEQTLTVYTDSTRSEIYAQAKVTLNPASNKRSMTWSKLPS